MRAASFIAIGLGWWVSTGGIAAGQVEDPATAVLSRFELGTVSVSGGLTAEQAAARALQVSATVSRSEASVVAAEAATRRAFIALWPRLDVTGTYSRLQDQDQGGVSQGVPSAEAARLRALVEGVDDPEARALLGEQVEAQLAVSNFEFPFFPDRFSVGVSLSLPISQLLLTLLPRHSAAANMASAERLRHRAEQSLVVLRTKEAFYALVRARAILVVAEGGREQTRAQKDRIDIMVENGAIAPVESARLQGELAAAEVAVVRAQSEALVAEESLRELLRLAPGAPVTLGEPLTESPPALGSSRQDFIDRAMAGRTDLQALQLLVSARRDDASAAAGALWPRLTVAGNYNLSDPNPNIFPEERGFGPTWDVGVTLQVSPNDMLDGHEAVHQADAAVSEATSDCELLERETRLAVTRAYSAYETARLSMQGSTVALTAAEETYRVRAEQLAEGRVVVTELMEAATAVTRARLTVLNAAIDARLARAQLDHAVGRD